MTKYMLGGTVIIMVVHRYVVFYLHNLPYLRYLN